MWRNQGLWRIRTLSEITEGGVLFWLQMLGWIELPRCSPRGAAVLVKTAPSTGGRFCGWRSPFDAVACTQFVLQNSQHSTAAHIASYFMPSSIHSQWWIKFEEKEKEKKKNLEGYFKEYRRGFYNAFLETAWVTFGKRLKHLCSAYNKDELIFPIQTE